MGLVHGAGDMTEGDAEELQVIHCNIVHRLCVCIRVAGDETLCAI